MLKRSAVAVLALAMLAVATPARAALEWSDNSFRFWYGTAFREPANWNKVAKSVVQFTHVDGYKWGGNFLNLNLLYSNTNDSVKGVTSVGAAEVYAVYRHTLSFNKISSSKTFAFGPIRDVGFIAGVDANTKNHGFLARKIMPTAGLSLALAVPGFLNVDFLANKEWAVNGVAPTTNPNFRRNIEFDVTFQLAAAWGIPVYGPVSFEGFGSVNLPKGKDGFNNDTATEVLLHPKVLFDVGRLFGSSGYKLGVGYQYWLNKFGNDNSRDVTGGSKESALFGEIAIHL